MTIFGIISGMRKHSGLMDILLHQLARLVQLHFSNILKIRGKMKIAVFIPSAKANGFSTDYSSYNITPCFHSFQKPFFLKLYSYFRFQELLFKDFCGQWT